MPGAQPFQSRRAFTLIELMVVVGIIVVLAGLLIPAITVVRENARKTEAHQIVAQLTLAIEGYANEDSRTKRYPYPGPFADNSNPYGPSAITYHRYQEPADPDLAFSLAFKDQRGGSEIPGTLQIIEDSGVPLPTLRIDTSDGDRRILDPWQRPYRYRFSLSGTVRLGFVCTHQAADPRLYDWNWNADEGREAKRNGQDPALARVYPYVYSWGRNGSDSDPCTWIYRADTRQ